MFSAGASPQKTVSRRKMDQSPTGHIPLQSTDRLQIERKSLACDAGVPGDPAALPARDAVDLESRPPCGNTTPPRADRGSPPASSRGRRRGCARFGPRMHVSAISSTASADGCVRCRLTKSSRAVPLSGCGRRNSNRTDSPNSNPAAVAAASRSRCTGRPSTRTSRRASIKISFAVAADAGVPARRSPRIGTSAVPCRSGWPIVTSSPRQTQYPPTASIHSMNRSAMCASPRAAPCAHLMSQED